ncbi:MAG: 3'(2'),5'-bisphosphate nucleotidase CysQ, partial [Halioglobus sp.]|nr:3'(2'),5'-bisphosphate nucleotidase CysQ [Halioglobus sp.]
MTDEARLRELVSPLLDLCREAGQAIRDHYYASSAGEFDSKSDDSPLTQADLASHSILQAGLTRLDNSIPLLSEESPASDIAQRRCWSRYWLVDPLDGTKEFLSRSGEFTINIALIDAHRPVLGLIYLPLDSTAYVGIPGEEALRIRLLGVSEKVTETLATRPLRDGQTLQVLSSRRHRGERLRKCLDWLAQHWGVTTRSNMGSALKFCRLSEGRGDFYP